MSKQAVRAGGAFVEIGAKTGLFDSAIAVVQTKMRGLAGDVQKISGQIKTAAGGMTSFGKSAMGVGAAIAGLGVTGLAGLVGMTKQFADAGGAVDDMAQRTGLAAEEVSALGYAALMSGTDIGAVEKAIRKMQTSGAGAGDKGLAEIVNAANSIAAIKDPGSKAVAYSGLAKRISSIQDPLQRAVAAMKAFGNSGAELLPLLTDANKVRDAVQQIEPPQTSVDKSTMSQFFDLAAAVASIEDPSERAAAAVKAFGKSGAELLPMLANGGDGIEAMIREAESLGLVMSGADAKTAADLGDAMDKLWKVLGAVSMSIGASLAPTLLSIVSSITYAATIVRQFIEDNREWVLVAAKVGAVVALVGGALVAFGATVAALGLMLAGLGAAFTMAASVVGAIMSPIGLVIIGVTALGVAIAYQTGAIGIALEWMASKWQELLNFVMPIIEGIKNALVQGKWAEAGQIAMLGLQVAFRAGLEPIYGLWTDLQTWLISGTVGLVTNMANVFAGIPTALMNGFATAITWLTGTWDQTVNYIAKKLLYLYSLFDSSVNYEQAAAQMDKEATQRAGKRQKELDAATAKRNQALQDANQGRLQFAEDLTRNVRQDAAQRKRDFATKNASLREEMRGLINSVNATAEGSSTAAAPLDEAKKVTQQAVAQLPTSQPTTASPAGTFSGFTAGMLGAQSPLVKLADMSKKSLDTLIKIEGNTRDNADLVLE